MSKENHYLTPMVREYDAQIFSNKYYDPEEIEAFKYVADIQTPSHLPSIYKKMPVKQEVTYLGKNDYYAFIELNNVVMKFSLADCKKSQEIKLTLQAIILRLKIGSF